MSLSIALGVKKPDKKMMEVIVLKNSKKYF